MTASTLPEMVRRIFTHQTTAFTINLSFGFMLRNVETENYGTTIIVKTTPDFSMFHTSSELERFLDDLSRHDMLEYIRQQRPVTKCVVHLLTYVTFYVNKINNHPIFSGAAHHEFLRILIPHG
jgi:hypothetical protein